MSSLIFEFLFGFSCFLSPSFSSDLSYFETKKPLQQIVIAFAREFLLPALGDVRTSAVATGVLGVGGNKGGVGVAFSLHRRRVAAVCAHLAPHQHAAAARSAHWAAIAGGLRFDAPAGGGGGGGAGGGGGGGAGGGGGGRWFGEDDSDGVVPLASVTLAAANAAASAAAAANAAAAAANAAAAAAAASKKKSAVMRAAAARPLSRTSSYSSSSSDDSFSSASDGESDGDDDAGGVVVAAPAAAAEGPGLSSCDAVIWCVVESCFPFSKVLERERAFSPSFEERKNQERKNQTNFFFPLFPLSPPPHKTGPETSTTASTTSTPTPRPPAPARETSPRSRGATSSLKKKPPAAALSV